VHFARDCKSLRTRTGIIPAVMLILILMVPGAKAATRNESPTPLIHTVKAGDTLIRICGEYRQRTNHYSLTDLMNDIRHANNLQSNLLRIGQDLTIPVLPREEYPRVAKTVAQGAEMRGIYLTGPACGVSSVWQRVDRFIEAGGNAVVFDAKDIDGGVSFHSRHPLARWGKGRPSPVISSLPDMMERFDRRGLYVVARLALFLDGELGRQRVDLALRDSTGNPWQERGCAWIDAAAPEVLDYNLTLALELAEAGVDEIQFDYVRFPTNGWREDWSTGGELDLQQTADHRRAVIAAFLTAVRDSLHDRQVKLSADLYGIMAWGRTADLALTGQDVPTIASIVDVICPMIYPSHFGPGFEGRRHPGDDPEYFIGEGTRRFVELAAGRAEVRPWLQAFPYRVSSYDGSYITKQVQTARNAGSSGWCLWNPACRYQVALGVLPDLCGSPLEPSGQALPVVAASPAGLPETTPERTSTAPVRILDGVTPVSLQGVLLPVRFPAKDESGGGVAAAKNPGDIPLD